MDGEGTLRSGGGGVYMGSSKQNLRHGRGHMLWANGDSYSGQWERGKMQVPGAARVCRGGGGGRRVVDSMNWGAKETIDSSEAIVGSKDRGAAGGGSGDGSGRRVRECALARTRATCRVTTSRDRDGLVTARSRDHASRDQQP